MLCRRSVRLDQDDTDVLRHGHEHLAMVFCQLLFVGLVFDLPELGHSITNHWTSCPNSRSRSSRVCLYPRQRQQNYRQRSRHPTSLCQNASDLNRVDDKVYTRFTELPTIVDRIKEVFTNATSSPDKYFCKGTTWPPVKGSFFGI